MKEADKSPPGWAKNIFYFLIIAILLICILTFLVRASCLFYDPDLQSISFAIVSFGVGLSFICGILWIGGVTNIISLSESTQKYLWVTLISGVLATTVTVYKTFFITQQIFTVTGSVEKIDGGDPRDVVISTRFPPLYPTPSAQKNIAIKITQESDGKFPTLAFSHPAYLTMEINLNDREKVTLEKNALKIKKPIMLIKTPGK